jgi:hypothetical protein
MHTVWNYLLVVYCSETKHLIGGIEKMHEQYVRTGQDRTSGPELKFVFPKHEENKLITQ